MFWLQLEKTGQIRHSWDMTGVILTLLVIWLIFVVLGAVLEGLFWLTVVGIVLFLATVAYGWMKRKTGAG